VVRNLLNALKKTKEPVPVKEVGAVLREALRDPKQKETEVSPLLVGLGDEAAALLLPDLADPTSVLLRQRTIRAPDQLPKRPPQAAPARVKAADDASRRTQAIAALGKVSPAPPEVKAALVKVLDSDEKTYHPAAAWALVHGGLADRERLAALLPHLD